MYWIGSRRNRCARLCGRPCCSPHSGCDRRIRDLRVFRSWASTRAAARGTFVDFAIERFAGCYGRPATTGGWLTFQNQLGHVPIEACRIVDGAGRGNRSACTRNSTAGCAGSETHLRDVRESRVQQPVRNLRPFVDFGQSVASSSWRARESSSAVSTGSSPMPIRSGCWSIPPSPGCWNFRGTCTGPKGRLLPTLVVLSVTGWWLMRLERRPGSVGAGASRSKPRIDTESTCFSRPNGG